VFFQNRYTEQPDIGIIIYNQHCFTHDISSFMPCGSIQQMNVEHRTPTVELAIGEQALVRLRRIE
jgi:hypothetical protein